MDTVYRRTWWSFVLRGALAIVFGLILVLFPQKAYGALILLFGAFVFVDGIVRIVTAFTGKSPGGVRTWRIAQGACGIVVGIITLVEPRVTAYVVLYLVAVWAIVVGVIEISGSLAFRKGEYGSWALAVTGVLLLVFGIVCAVAPVTGATAISWLIGIFSLIAGIVLVAVGIVLKGSGGEIVVASHVETSDVPMPPSQ